MKNRCPFCDKEYTRQSSFNKHKVSCEFLSKSKQEHKIEEEETNNLPSYKELVLIVQQLALECNNQKQKIQYLEKLIEPTKKKINVIQWLNTNIIPTVDFNTWKSQISIFQKHLTYLFDSPIIDAVTNVLQDIIKLPDDGQAPIFSFTEKPSKFYIFKNDSWCEIQTTDLALLFKKIQSGLLQIILKWKTENLANPHSSDRLLEIYNRNMIKIMSISLEPDPTFNKIRSNFYNMIKIEIKHLIEFEFEF